MHCFEGKNVRSYFLFQKKSDRKKEKNAKKTGFMKHNRTIEFAQQSNLLIFCSNLFLCKNANS